jgi:hypothetical protein
MKIDQLLELGPPKKQPVEIPAKAQAIKDRRLARQEPKPVVGQNVIPNVNNTGLPQPTTNAQPTTLGAPAPLKLQQPTAPEKATEPDELAALQKNAGLPATKEPEQLQATPAEEPSAFGNMANNLVGNKEPAPDVDTGNTVVNKADPNNPNITSNEPSAFRKFLNYANSEKSGEDALKFGRGLADAGQAVGQGVANVANAGATAVKGVGNLAAQTAGGVGQTLGAAAGGLKHGFQTAASGQRFGAGDTANTGRGTERLGQALRNATGVTQAHNRGNVGGSGFTSGSGSAGSGMSIDAEDELNQLKSTVQAIDQRLKRANI